MSGLEEIKFELSALNEKMDTILTAIKKLDRKTEPWKKPKKVKIPGEPKKPLSAYFHYQASVRSNYQGVPFGEQAKAIATEWKKMTDKSKYEELAVQDKVRYTEEKAIFDAEQND
jgi:hypothetical protein|tara:strand:- start:2756 stop:3100 length:345 start_codon:yes stop_codon:yes gene_type:complete